MPEQLEPANSKQATFGMGCFWAGDSLFGATQGVITTSVGYSNGAKENPTYRNLGDHTEVIHIEFDPAVISYSDLLDLFWNNHEYGLTRKIKKQYMSLILYHDEEQRRLAEETRELQQKRRNERFATVIQQFKRFYPAEDYHQKYRLQGHPYLVEAIGIKSAQDLQTSPLAAKMNGFIAGAVNIDEFERQVPLLDLNEKAVNYARKYVINNQGGGLSC